MKIKQSFIMLICGLLFTEFAFAIEASKVEKAKQTKLGLYYTAVEANKHMSKYAKQTLFVDVRDPAELHTVGMPTNVDANVPFLRIDLTRWNTKKMKFQWKKNPRFADEVAPRLLDKGLTKKDTIIVICGSGKRAAKAVNALAKAGYKKVYPVVDGYKAWQKSKLPWSRKLAVSKMYGNPAIPITGPEVFDDIDGNADGYISKAEAKVRADLIAHWNIADKDKDGQLDVDEYVAYESRSGYAPAEVEIPEVGAAPVQ